jgi:hypothetical protein
MWDIMTIGWVGSVSVLLAFIFQKSSKPLDKKIVSVLNIIGGSCLAVNTFYYGAIPSGIVNIIWVAVAVYFLIKVK